MKRIHPLLLVCATAAMSVLPTLSAAQPLVGRVVAIDGGALLIRGTQQINVQPGALIEKGDILKTGANSMVQLRTADDGIFTVQPESRFVFEDYAFDGKGAASNKSFYKIEQGAFATMSGSIKADNSYRMSLPAMAVAVHGTVYASAVCGGDCVSATGAALPAGSYVSVSEGAVAVSNAAGSITVAAGQSAFAPDAKTPPALTPAPPVALINPSNELAINPTPITPGVITRPATPTLQVTTPSGPSPSSIASPS